MWKRLVLQGSDNLSGAGNASNNSIHGNAGDNQLNGGAGADVLIGNAGDDTFVFVVGQADGDTIVDFDGDSLTVRRLRRGRDVHPERCDQRVADPLQP